jgi:O-antigen ligase
VAIREGPTISVETKEAQAVAVAEEQPSALAAFREAKWSLGFVGMLAYLVVEYMRLSAQYPVFQLVQIGKAVVIVCALGWLIAPRIKGDRRLILPVDVTLAALFFFSFISACFAANQKAAWSTVLDLLRWILIYFLIGRIVASSWRQRIFMYLFLLLNLKMAQAAIRGFHSAKEFGESAEAMAKFGFGAGSVGFFSNAGDFGVAMCVVWPLAGILLLGESKKIPRLFLLAAFLGFSGAIIVCGSRGAVLGAVITAAVAWARNPRRLGMVVIFLLFIPSVIYILPQGSKARWQSAANYQEDKTATHRLELWKAGLRMFRDHPILGVGPGNYAQMYSDTYAAPGDDPAAWAPHNIYIQAMSELGVAGTLPVLLLLFFCFRINSRTRKLLDPKRSAVEKFDFFLAYGLDLALVGYMVSGAFLTVLYYPHLWIVLGLSVGLHTAVTSRQAAGLPGDSAPISTVPMSSQGQG